MASLFSRFFGFRLPENKLEEKPDSQGAIVEPIKSFVVPNKEDGSAIVQTGGGYFGTYVDIDGVIRNEIQLVTKYRDMAIQPEVESAIDDICNEAIVQEDRAKTIEINVDDIPAPEKTKKAIREEFDNVLRLMNFQNNGYQIFRRWYIDGKFYYHILVDPDRPKNGIQELRYIDPRRIKKIREIKMVKDRTGLDIVESEREYYIYSDKNILTATSVNGVPITPDCIAYVTSGLVDTNMNIVLSYLHKAIKTLNNLRMLEDATVIYRLARAPERRLFYIDVGNMSTIKAEQYLKSVMTKYRNKLVYDANTGEVKDDRKFQSMIDDIWLPRREGGRSSEISVLPGGQNLGEVGDVEMFQKKLYDALSVPFTRTQPQTGGGIFGRATDITRDEIKFSKFIDRLRNQFAHIFDDLLGKQLILKNIMDEATWNEYKEFIWYDFLKDNDIAELKETELLNNRLAVLSQVDPFVGRYFSREWVCEHVLQQTKEEIDEMLKQIDKEKAAGLIPPPEQIGMGQPQIPDIQPDDGFIDPNKNQNLGDDTEQEKYKAPMTKIE